MFVVLFLFCYPGRQGQVEGDQNVEWKVQCVVFTRTCLQKGHVGRKSGVK